MLLRRGLTDSIRIDSDVSKKRIRGVGEILNLPKGKEFFYLLLYKRYINTMYYHAGRAYASRMLPSREVNPLYIKLLNFKAI